MNSIKPLSWEELLAKAFPNAASIVYSNGFTMAHFLSQSSATPADIHTLFLRTYINGHLDETRLN